MSLNTIRAVMILNAKKAGGVKNPKVKGWTDEARAKAAATRKAKKKVAAAKAPKKAVKKAVAKKAAKKATKKEPKVLLSKVTGKKTITQKRKEAKAKQKKELSKIPKKPGTPFEATIKGGLKSDKPYKVKLTEVTGSARLNRGKERWILSGTKLVKHNGAFSLPTGARVFHKAK